MKLSLFRTFLSVILLLPLSAAGDASVPPRQKVQDAVSQVRQLRPDAIEIGNGPVDVYVFIDPNCPHSRDFVEMVSESPKMLTRYHYFVFLYALPHFGSSAVINAIYASTSPKQALLSYMVGRKPIAKLSRLTPPAVQAKVFRIEHGAKTIGVDKRPYLILDKKKTP